MTKKILLSLILAIVVTTLIFQSASAVTLTRTITVPLNFDPNDPATNFEKWLVPIGATYTKIVAVTDSIDNNYITSTVNNDHQTFVLTGGQIPSDAVVNSLSLVVSAEKPTTQSQTTKFSITVAKGTTLNDAPSGGYQLSPSYTLYTRLMTTNPTTNVKWTASEINTGKTTDNSKLSYGVAQNTDAKEVRVTKITAAASITGTPSITITSPSQPVSMPWGTLTISGTTTYDVTSDTVSVNWGDSYTTTATRTGHTWTASHPYLHAGTYNIQAKLIDNALTPTTWATSAPLFPVTMLAHATSVNTPTLDSTTVFWGKTFQVTATKLTDNDASGAGVAGTITYSGSAVSGTPSGTTVTSGDLSGPVTVTSVGAGNVGTGKTVIGNFAGNSDYLGSSSATPATIEIKKHTTALTIGDIPNTPWGQPISESGTLTDTVLSSGIGSASITFTGTGTTGGLAAATTADVTGAYTGSGNAPGAPIAAGLAVVANYVGDPNYEPATSSTDTYDTTVHTTALTIGDIPNTPWGQPISESGTLTDTVLSSGIGSASITFTGTGTTGGLAAATTADVTGAYTGSGNAPGAPIAAGLAVVANYAGDPTKYAPAISLTDNYDTLKHNTAVAAPTLSTTNIGWGLTFAATSVLIDTDASNTGIPGKTIDFSGTGVTGTATSGATDGTGTTPSTTVTASGKGTEGLQQVGASFGGDADYNSATSSTTTGITILKHNTAVAAPTLSTTSVKWSLTFTATSVLIDTDASNTGISGKIISFNGTGVTGTAKSGATDGTGTTPSTTVTASGKGTVGTQQVKAGFDADADYNSATSSTTDITILKHDTTLTVSADSLFATTYILTALGTLTDNDLGNVGADGATIVFTGTTGTTSIPPPATTNPVTFSDAQGMTISTLGGNVLNVHANTVIQTPSNPPAASLSLKNVGTGTLTIEVSFSGGGSPNPFPITKTESGGDDLVQIVLGSGSGGITQIKITQFPGSDTGGTIAVSELVTENKDLVTVQDILFDPTTDVISSTDGGSTNNLLTKSSGAYSSSATLGPVSPPSYLLQAGFAGDASYNEAIPVSVPYTIGAVPVSGTGLGDAATILGDTNKGFIQSTTCPDGTTNAGPNGDYICAAWKSTGIPIGAPVNGVQYYYTLDTPHSAAKDVYVEADYMQGHTPDPNAISDVVTKFQQHNIFLHVLADEVLPHVAAMNVWKDGDLDQTNDFDSIKNAHFGTIAEHPVLIMTGTPTITAAAGSPITSTISASGIQIITPTSLQTGGYTNGKIVLSMDMTLGAAATPTIGAVSIAATSLPAGFTLGIPTQAVATKSGIVNGWVVTITIPFTATSAMGPVNIGTISATETFSASPGAITFARTAGSPSVFTDLLSAKAQVYHYFIWAHSVGPCGPSGVSELPGNDGVIALGCNFDPSALEFPGTASTDANGKLQTVGTRSEQAGTFMHELGHQLGLNHGGPKIENGVSVLDNAINCKPDYASVMSYTRQMPNYLGANWVLDYSSGTLGALDETKLQEFQSLITGSPAPTIVWNTPKADASGKTYRTDAANDPAGLDWDGSGTITGSLTTPTTVSADVNNFGVTGCAASLPESVAYPYKDHNDWANLNFNLRTGIANSFDGNTNDAPNTPSLPEPTADELKTTTLLSSVYKGNNPPPNQDGTSVFNTGQTIPLKFALYKSDGVTLITYSTIGHVEYTTDGVHFTRISPDFALDSTGTFYQLNWQTSKNQFTVGQYVGIDIVLDLPNNQGGATTKTLFDPGHLLTVPGTTTQVTQLIQFIK